MKIGIVTQTLTSNYGGILQNYALQQMLKRMGHDPVTLDQWVFPWSKWVADCVKITVKKALGRREEYPIYPLKRRQEQKPLRRFVENNIVLTSSQMIRYDKNDITDNHLDAVVVGSDQVWRPLYNQDLEDKFLSFAAGLDIKRIAYAASFGTDEWEFTSYQTSICAALAKNFDAISVREETGVWLCEKYLNVKAVNVLDPTLLLKSVDYEGLCAGVAKREPFVFAYILDQNEQKLSAIKEFAESKHLPYFIKNAGPKVNPDDSVELWLSYFRDASYIITDSFHGTAFSINFNKDFFVYGNPERGNTRFDSLLGAFDLKGRMIVDVIPDLDDINWTRINQKREQLLVESYNWLCNSLDK